MMSYNSAYQSDTYLQTCSMPSGDYLVSTGILDDEDIELIKSGETTYEHGYPSCHDELFMLALKSGGELRHYSFSDAQELFDIYSENENDDSVRERLAEAVENDEFIKEMRERIKASLSAS